VARPKTDPVYTPWSHVDQSPLRTNLQCVQGIVNFLPNGPDDGGLMVLQNSNRFYAELWQHFDHKKGEKGWNKWEQQFLDEEMCDWLISKGCKWVKICANPGDLLLWDSVSSPKFDALYTTRVLTVTRERYTMELLLSLPTRVLPHVSLDSTHSHHLLYLNSILTSRVDVCYKPSSFVSEQTKKDRLDIFAKKQGSAHDPSILRSTPRLPPDDHPSYIKATQRPLQNPVLSKRTKQLIGLEQY